MKKIFYILFALAISFSFACKKNKKQDQQTLVPQKDTAVYPGYEEFYSDESDMGSDSSSLSSDTSKSNDQVMVEDTAGNVKPATPKDIQKSKNFFVIVGSFKKYQNAQKKLNYLKKIGYAAEILPKFGEYNRVSAASFNNETSARNELKKLRKKFKNNTFWLLIR
jgi:cell division septation protein DedD